MDESLTQPFELDPTSKPISERMKSFRDSPEGMAFLKKLHRILIQTCPPPRVRLERIKQAAEEALSCKGPCGLHIEAAMAQALVEIHGLLEDF
jgi:hypothetical protein